MDCKSTLDIWRDAAQQGNAEAQYHFGTLYWKGVGVEKDDGEAVQWYRRAADQGYAPAQYDLGIAYRDGRGVAKNEADFVQWNRTAAEQGFAPAQHNLGVQYFNGIRGLPQDSAEAMKWLRSAADQGWVPSQGMIAVIYSQGRGAAKDPVEAYKWFTLAAQGAQNPVRDQIRAARDELAKSMNRGQIDDALRAASDWGPKLEAYPEASVPRLGEERAATAGEVIDAGSYEVPVPPGEGWKVQVDRHNGIVQFTRGDRQAKETTMIATRRQAIPLASSARSDGDIVTAFLCAAESAFAQQGAAKSYVAREGVRQDTTIGDKHLYVLRYAVTDRSLRTSVTSTETVYLLLPKDWRRAGRGYAFALAQGRVSSDAAPPADGSLMYPVISGFNEK
jgi:TPR repeat protein